MSKKFKIQQGNCPNCDCTNLSYYDSYPDDDSLIYEFECGDCGVMGNEYYELIFDGVSVEGKDDYYRVGQEVEKGKQVDDDE